MSPAGTTSESGGLGDPRRRSSRTVLACVAGMGLIWLVAVLSHPGHLVDNAVAANRTKIGWAIWLNHEPTFRLLSDALVVAAAAALVAIGWMRGRRAPAVVAAVAVAGAAASAQVLKDEVIHRPTLTLYDTYAPFNTLPSGHTAAVTALALGLVLVAPTRMRHRVALGGATWVALQGTGTVAVGWHRPSDVLAGYLLALTWLAAALWLLARRDELAPATGTGAGRPGWLPVASAATVAAVVASTVPLVASKAGWDTLAYGVAAVAVGLAGLATVWWFDVMLRGWSIDAIVLPGAAVGVPETAPQTAPEPARVWQVGPPPSRGPRD